MDSHQTEFLLYTVHGSNGRGGRGPCSTVGTIAEAELVDAETGYQFGFKDISRSMVCKDSCRRPGKTVRGGEEGRETCGGSPSQSRSDDYREKAFKKDANPRFSQR